MADSTTSREGPHDARPAANNLAAVDGPPEAEAATSAAIDRRLRRLVVWHYVIGSVTALFAVFGVPIIPTGWMLMNSAGGEMPESVRIASELYGAEKEFADPELRAILGACLVAGGAIIVALSLVHGALIAYVGRSIARRRRWLLCVLFSIVDLTYLIPLPLGTVLSVCALRLLFRRDVRRQFRSN